jgi:hypothetical protein
VPDTVLNSLAKEETRNPGVPKKNHVMTNQKAKKKEKKISLTAG